MTNEELLEWAKEKALKVQEINVVNPDALVIPYQLFKNKLNGK